MSDETTNIRERRQKDRENITLGKILQKREKERKKQMEEKIH